MATALVAVVCTLSACGAPRRPPLDLDPPPPAGAIAEAPPASDDRPPESTLVEEPLGDEPTGPGMQAGVLSVEAPPLLDAIGPATPATTAAAIRLVESARTRMAVGDTGAALDQLERAIALDPGSPYAYYYLAQLYLAHASYDQAMAFAGRAASASAHAPDWASRAYTLQGNALEALGRLADARAAYTRAVQIAPRNLAAQVGLARLGAPAERTLP